MEELGVENVELLKKFKDEKISEGMKPTLVFNGGLWQNNHQYGMIRNFLVDMFQRDVGQNERLQGLQHVLSFTALENKILFSSYRVVKLGTRMPTIQLNEIGPKIDLNVRLTQRVTRENPQETPPVNPPVSPQGTLPVSPQRYPAGLIGAILGSLFGAIFGALFGAYFGPLPIILTCVLWGVLFFSCLGALVSALFDALFNCL